jgi:hypothetical protein
MLPAIALNVGYNLMAYGKPFATGYLYVQSQAYHIHITPGPLGLTSPSNLGIQLPTLHNLYEITFGLYRGIFPISPVLILFFAGLYFMWRRKDLRPEFWLCLAVVVIYFLIDAGRPADTNGWSGGSSVASRHLTPMIPFMIVPIVFGFRNRVFRVVFAVLAIISICLMFMIVSSTYLFPYNDSNPLANEVFPNFFHGQIQSNWIVLWHSTLHLSGFVSLLPFFAVAALLIGRIAWLVRNSPESHVPPGVELTAYGD